MRQVFVLAHDHARARAANAVRGAAEGFVVTIEEPRRSNDQNALWWPLLQEISKQAFHPVTGEKLAPEWWRMVILDATGREQPKCPSLDGSHDVPMGLSSRKLRKREFSDLIEMTYKVGAELGVTFPPQRVAA